MVIDTGCHVIVCSFYERRERVTVMNDVCIGWEFNATMKLNGISSLPDHGLRVGIATVWACVRSTIPIGYRHNFPDIPMCLDACGQKTFH